MTSVLRHLLPIIPDLWKNREFLCQMNVNLAEGFLTALLLQAEGSSKGKARIKELEQQLETQRAMYTRRIRNLELKVGSGSGVQAAAAGRGAAADRRASKEGAGIPKGLGKVTPLVGAAPVSAGAAAHADDTYTNGESCYAPLWGFHLLIDLCASCSADVGPQSGLR
jgi:hypothetical protein